MPRTACVVAKTATLCAVLQVNDLMRYLPVFPAVSETLQLEAQDRLSALGGSPPNLPLAQALYQVFLV